METFAATIEWYGPYPNLTAVHQAVIADDWSGPWTDGLYMALGEHDKAHFIAWAPDTLADRVLDMDCLEHDKLPKGEGNRSFYIGDVHPYTGRNANLRQNIGANAALLLIRTLEPVLNDQPPEPQAGNNCCMSVFSCFYDINNHEEAIDPLPGFPVIVAYNPYANNQTGRRITVYAPAPPKLQYQDAEPRAVAFIQKWRPR